MPSPSRSFDPVAAASALMWVYLAAAVLEVVALVAPHEPGVHVPVQLGIAALCAVLAALLRARGARFPRWAFTVLVATGTAIVTTAIHFSMGVPNAASLFYFWGILYAFYFFARPEALAHAASVGVAYALLIVLRPPPFPGAVHWVTTIAAMVGAGLLVGTLRSRLDRVIASLAEAASTDALTGVLNRRGFEHAAGTELDRARRTDRPVSLLLADLDNFKDVNDTQGHAAGDEVLQHFGELLSAQRRGHDVAGRFGGEEFVLLLPDTGADDAARAAERLRALVADSLPLTASFGVATFPDDALTLDDLVAAADGALYRAKREGRDRVALAVAA